MCEQSPEELLAYFERSVAFGDPNSQYATGVALSKRRIALLAQESVSEEEFRSLLSGIEEVGCPPGSGIFDLWLQVRHWGYELGFAVPDDHPWRVDPRRWVRELAEEYAGHITAGKEYEVLATDEARKLVRVVADTGRTRWYPTSLFRPPLIPERKWIRKG